MGNNQKHSMPLQKHAILKTFPSVFTVLAFRRIFLHWILVSMETELSEGTCSRTGILFELAKSQAELPVF